MCMCTKQTVQELRDSAASLSEHRGMLHTARLHSSCMAPHRTTRTGIDDLSEKVQILTEIVLDLKE